MAAREVRKLLVGQQLRQGRRDDGLAAVEVLVELDRVRRLGDVVDEERNDAGIEVPQELRHLVVGPLAEQAHVRPRGDGREVHVELAAGEHDGGVRVGVGDLREQRHVHPGRERSVVADDRVAHVAEQLVGRIAGAVVLGVHRVAREDQPRGRALPLFLEPVGRDDRRVGAADELLLQRQDAFPEPRKVRPLVHAVVHDPPAEALPQALGERGPERDLDEADRVADREVGRERLERGDQGVHVGNFHLAAVDVQGPARPDAQLPHPLGLAREVPGRSAGRQELRRREVEDAVAVAAELGGQLLRALEAEVPVDDRKDDDVVAAGGLHRYGVGGARARHGLALLELDEAVGTCDRGDHAAQPAREGPGHESGARGKERGAGRRCSARRAAQTVRGLAEASEARGFPTPQFRERRDQVLLAGLGDRPLALELLLQGAHPLGRDALAHRDLLAQEGDTPLLLPDDRVEAADFFGAGGDGVAGGGAPHPVPLPPGEGVRKGRLGQASDRCLQSRVPDLPRILEGDLAALGDDHLAVGLADEALESGDELIGRVVQRDDVGVGLELRQAARDDRLSRREVLVELDGIGRLGQRRALEGNRADVEAGDVAGQVGVGHFTEEVDVRSPFEALERGALRGADQDEAPVGMLAGRQGDCLGVEPRRDGAVVADDGARVLRERARVAGGKFRESLRVGGVRESQRVRPDLADPLEQRP